MKTRIIHTKIWKDNYFSQLNRAEKLAFIYLLTNESINLCGIYEINDLELKTWVGLTDTEIENVKKTFTKDGRFIFYKNWVKVIHHGRYNTNYSGTKNEIALQRELTYIPDSVSKELDSLSIDYRYPIDSPIIHKSETINHKSETINHKSETNSKYISQDYLKTLKDDEVEMEDLIGNFTCTRRQILDKAEDFLDYCISKGKVYKNYKSALSGALSKDFGRRSKKEKTSKSTERYDKFGNLIGGVTQ